jgi:hypothetical protein
MSKPITSIVLLELYREIHRLVCDRLSRIRAGIEVPVQIERDLADLADQATLLIHLERGQ